MKIFISYGHGDHTQVVDRLFDALIREGHEPWKDDRYEGSSGIPAGQDFTELIYRTIDASDFVIAFVTNQTKDKPYCRDERQRAYNSKGIRFIQIRMDRVDITLGNAQSYIDMSDVVGNDGQINERLFEEKLRSLFAAFRDPASFAEGGFTPWAKFDTHLKVPGALKYHDFIASLDGEDFVGRQWLLEKCKDWAMDSSLPCRLFVILGEAGTGKTAFVRRLAEDEELVRSVHICIYDKPSTRTARDTLRDLAYVLAQNNKSYFDFLKMRNFEQLQDMTIDGLFEFLFIDPLKTETQKYLLVIDGLDEMEESTGFKPLMRLFRQYAQQLNPNISFLVTGRPDAYITDMLKTVAQGKRLESVILDKDAGKEDLECYIRGKLEQLGCYSQSLADKLLDACDGNFEYLSLLFREALEEGLRVFEGMRIPRGLNERYAQYLDRRMDMADCSRLSREQRKLLSVLCVSYEPLPVPVLCAVTGLEDYDIDDELELFGSLIRRFGTGEDTPRICLFTKSFRDFLLGRHFDKYCADHKLGTRLIAQYLMDRCVTERALKKHPYLEQYGFVHLLQYAAWEPEDVVQYCKELAASGVDVDQRIANALHLGETSAIHGYWELREEISQYETVVRYLKGKRSADALTEFVALYRKENDLAAALMLEADILCWQPSPEIYRQAEESYRKVLEICTQKYQTDPSRQTRQQLSNVYGRLGDLTREKQTPEGDAQAEQWYRKSLEMDEQNHAANPCYQTRRNLAITYSCMGDLERRKQTPEGNAQAEQWYRKAMAFYEQNYQSGSSYESRRGVAVIYYRLGDLERRKQTPEGTAQAEQWYRKALTLYEENYQQNPCYQSRRGLTSIYDRLGNLARDKRTTEGTAAAEQWYLKMLQIDEQNHGSNPCYQTRRDLSISYSRLGDLARGRRTPEGDAQAEQWFRKSLEISEQNYRNNPGSQSQRSLSVDYGRLGKLALDKKTPEGFAEAEHWYRKALQIDEQRHQIDPGYESRRDLSVDYNRLGDIAREKQTPEGIAEAEQWYLKMLDVDEQNYASNPCYQIRRDLSVTYNRLGDLALKKQTPEGDVQAEQWFRKALQMDEQNHASNPGYQSRRDLSVEYNRLGNLARKKQTPEGDVQAEQWYRKALQMDEQNHAANPGYESRRDLSVDYIHLGDVARDKQTPEGIAEAEQWYLKMLQMDEQNHEANPCYQTRRDLSIDYCRLGDLTREKQTPEGDAQAEHWYRKALQMYEQNHGANPCYQTRRDLSIVYNRLGDLALKKQTLEGSAEAEHWYRKALQIDEQNHAANPGYESRRDLGIAYNRLGDLARDKQTPEGTAEAEQWYLKMLQMDEQNHEANPCYQTRRDLSVDYTRLVNLARKKQTPEGDAQAEQWFRKLLEVTEQNYQTNPCTESQTDLRIAYARLYDVAQRKGTPEAQAEANLLREKYNALKS